MGRTGLRSFQISEDRLRLLRVRYGLAELGSREQAVATQDKIALGSPRVKHMLLLMDRDENGKVSKDEFMKYMQAEFDRLDKDKSGQLDVKELTHAHVQANHASE